MLGAWIVMECQAYPLRQVDTRGFRQPALEDDDVGVAHRHSQSAASERAEAHRSDLDQLAFPVCHCERAATVALQCQYES